MHTFIPDHDDIEGWMDKLYQTQQTFKKDLIDRYAAAIVKPDFDKMKKYISDVNFYNRDDEIIKLAKILRRGKEISPKEVEKAVKAEADSHYAQAVKKGYNYIEAASKFFTEDMEVEALKDKLKIGKKGRHGGWV